MQCVGMATQSPSCVGGAPLHMPINNPPFTPGPGGLPGNWNSKIMIVKSLCNPLYSWPSLTLPHTVDAYLSVGLIRQSGPVKRLSRSKHLGQTPAWQPEFDPKMKAENSHELCPAVCMHMHVWRILPSYMHTHNNK